METADFITKNRKLLPSQDFHYLFQMGLTYVEKLGAKFWTDYNAHDPGITVLDILCYAITELGYRTDFDIQDLLTNAKGKIENSTFFPASTIFTNVPLTANDYRKLLIDLEGVSNAWYIATQTQTDSWGYNLPHASETKIFVNKLEDKLSLKNKDKKNTSLPELPIRGLAKIKLELEDDPLLGDLNFLLLEFAFWKDNRWVKIKIVPQFIDWNDPLAKLFQWMDTPSKITIDSVKKMQDIVFLVVKRYSKPSDALHFRIFPEDVNEMDLIVAHFQLEKNVCEVISKLEQKRKLILNTYAKVVERLQDNRNFTEDFLCVEVVEKVDVAVCADIELELGVDPVEVLSQVQIAIDTVICPKINFYTLSQLVNEGMHSTAIFTGPKLTHGFIKEEELNKAQLPSAIHASDIIALLMAIKGVKSVNNLLMTAYNSLGKPIAGATNQRWVLALTGEVKPVFNPDLSKLLLFQKNIPFLLSESQQLLVDQKVILHKTQLQQKKLRGTRQDYEIESGVYFELDKYFSIQDDFPVNYGIGKNSLSDKEPDLRKAQAKQLKGYLYFFEQILADFFHQLYHANSLLDCQPMSQTYFPKFLSKNDWNGADFYSKMVFSATLNDKLLHGLTDEDLNLYESKSLFYDRRNRALDHLLARFSERFNEYVFMMYQITQDASGTGVFPFDNAELVEDKQDFLSVYPELSSQRGLGMNYMHASYDTQLQKWNFHTFWNSLHRGGYEKRVARLLGIDEIPLRNIVTEETPQTQWTVETNPIHYVFKIVSPAVQLIEKWEWAQLHFLNQNLYKIELVSSKFGLYLMNENQKIARLDKKFDTHEEAFAYLQTMIRKMNQYYENFYCVEHLLLRPFNTSPWTDDELLSVCVNDDCFDAASIDPYSFKATLILPGYLSRFQNLIFRKYAEKVFRQEAPAHSLLKICWVNSSDMLKFQKAYRNWVEAYGHYRFKKCNHSLKKSDEVTYHSILKELLLALKELNTIYPEGNLYDCQISETKNPMVLGSTSLGTL
ncbi:hypothetical protein [Flavobacterium sp.]|uniref:hypothetical protein n=1 Tax=Flavobacterium sp. TaxID=239 RepID=UPI003D13F114